MANHDKIYLSYSGALGEVSESDSKKRISWILDKIDANCEIMDLGCSQGIISILAAQKGNRVTGIDIEKEAVYFASDLLNREYSDVKENVNFICADFLEYENEKKYDIILMTEVLEHLENPKKFVEKAKDCLKENGKIIITVPFGINDHPDHKTTFYYANLLELLENCFFVKEIHFMERWMGVVADFNEEYAYKSYSKGSIRKLEENFYAVDRKMTDRVNELYKLNINANAKYKESLGNYSKMKANYININNKLSNLNNEFEKIKNEYANNLKEMHLSNQEEIDTLNELKSIIKRLEAQNNYLKSENAEYQRKMQIIKDTFVGKILVWGYRTLKKNKR